MDDVEKLSVVPLRWYEPGPNDQDKVDLGCGFSVERVAKFLASADLALWRWQAKKDDDKIDSWDMCLVHRYHSPPLIGEAEERSVTLLAYVLAHLRIINPHRDSTDDYLQLSQQSDGTFWAFSCAKASFRPNRFLCDCENLCCVIKKEHVYRLKEWIPWIVEFADNWRHYYPLYLSMFFIEKACIDTDFRTRHLFRVMALEALYCSDADFGKKALKSKLTKFIGWHTDLYKAYEVDYLHLPEMPLTDSLIDDVYTLRNKIAHADVLPGAWVKETTRPGLNRPITYADQLCEAAGSMARLSWLRIMSDKLQKIFSEKKQMEDFFSN